MTFETLKENMPYALASVTVLTIQKWEHQVYKWIEAYRDGLGTQDAQAQIIWRLKYQEESIRECEEEEDLYEEGISEEDEEMSEDKDEENEDENNLVDDF
ncbi:hypothetical protein H2248_004212 [Termitomyces sp. 'cryptogamus']|nr:hypothetical protein H2248_004212 [Termitomyces sp. 'cryptogamus']